MSIAFMVSQSWICFPFGRVVYGILGGLYQYNFIPYHMVVYETFVFVCGGYYVLIVWVVKVILMNDKCI